MIYSQILFADVNIKNKCFLIFTKINFILFIYLFIIYFPQLIGLFGQIFAFPEYSDKLSLYGINGKSSGKRHIFKSTFLHVYSFLRLLQTLNSHKRINVEYCALLKKEGTIPKSEPFQILLSAAYFIHIPIKTRMLQNGKFL